jgi:AcrR family transcriptional regulator
MARPLSPEKHSALLLSAMQAVAEQGVLASTSSIARRAGVAEGTLFTYFKSKEVLFQELYLHLKRSLAGAMMSDFPAEADYRQRMQYIFQRYVSWGLNNAVERVVVARLSASGQVSDDTRAQAMEPFLAVSRMMQEGVQDGVLVDAPISFISSVIESIANTTIEHVEKLPEEAERHRQLGFHVLWRAITV